MRLTTIVDRVFRLAGWCVWCVNLKQRGIPTKLKKGKNLTKNCSFSDAVGVGLPEIKRMDCLPRAKEILKE